MLLQFGAKLDKPLDDGRTALTIAMETNSKDMIETLLEASLSDNFINKKEFMYEMAKRYRRVDQGLTLAAVYIACSKFVHSELLLFNIQYLS